MPKYPKNHKDVLYYVKGKKRPISGSTKSTSDFLAIVNQDNPNMTISELKDLITNKDLYILNPEAVKVLDDHINKGYGDCVPDWR